MDGQLVCAHRKPAPGAAEAFACLAAGVLVTADDGRITCANLAAEQLFAPFSPIGLALRDLLDRSGCVGGDQLAGAVERGTASAPVTIGWRDGRSIDGRSNPLPGGGAAVTLLDVTAYVMSSGGQSAALAARDPLTGLANRASLCRRLAEVLATPSRAGVPLAVIRVSLDRFKAVNDTLGHTIGDALLTKVADRLRNAVREGDMVARLDGDGFAILQTGAAEPQAAEALTARLVDLIGRTYLVGGHPLDIGASVGVAIAAADGDDPDVLMKHADLALHRARIDGRGTVRFFQGGMDTDMQARRLLELDLRRALAMRELELVYQPQINLASNRLTGFEALLRWHHPTRGTISPAVFIPLAEELGLIAAIGEWVLRTACRTAARWPPWVSIAVNVSPLQFRGNRLVPTVTSILASSGLDAARLELEITEGALLGDTDQVLQALHALKALGVRISMDDFGTGYSSLGYLQKFPFDKIKIDQSFVRGCDTSLESNAIVRAVIALGTALGIITTAEGVETDEQLVRMRAAGCTQVQGYLTGRPLSLADANALVRCAHDVPGDCP